MRRTIISIVGGIVLLAAGFFVARTLAGTERAQRKQPPQVLQTVFTEKVQNRNIPTTVYETGALMAKNKIELFSEVQGVMESTSKEFKPGSTYRKGETLVRIRNNDYVANLRAQKSTLQNLITSILPDLRLDFPEAYQKWDTYIREFDIDSPVKELPEPTSEKEKFFITGKNIYTTYYNTKNMEVVYNKYLLRAPFNGILTESLVTPGTLVRQGQKLGELIDPSIYEMKVAVGKTLYPYLSVGKEVSVKEDQYSSREWIGRIVRINGKVDQATQTVEVFIDLKGKDLKEGMFLIAEIKGKDESNVYEVNRSLLIDDSYLYVVKDKKLELVEINPVFFTENTVIVRGLENGQLVVNRPVPAAYSGMEVELGNNEKLISKE